MDLNEQAAEWINGKRVVLTGATGGIGQALSKHLIDCGAKLLALGRNSKRLADLSDLGAEVLEVDLTDSEGLPKISSWISENWDSVDVLIHNAASPVSGDGVEDIKHKEIDESFNTGPIAAIALIKLTAHYMSDGGRVILTSSTSGIAGFSNMPAYCGAKWSIEGIARACSHDLFQSKIMVNSVIVPATQTELSRPHYSPEIFNMFPKPEDVLEPFIYLLTPLAERVSGQTISYNGPVGTLDRTIPPLAKLRAIQPPMLPPSRRELIEDGITEPLIKADIGETPFPPSPEVARAVNKWMSSENTQEYPDAKCLDLRKALAKKHELELDQILVAPSSSQILSWIIDLLADPSDEIICAEPCFSLWNWKAASRGVQLVKIENKTVHHNLMAAMSKVTPSTRIIYFDSPSNPLGDTIDEEHFLWFMSRLPSNIWVVVDHAYQDFINESKGIDTTCKRWLKDPRILSIRTFSKSHALASWRVGYMAAHAATIKQLSGAIIPFTVSTPSQVAALAALNDTEYSQMIQSFYINERSRIFKRLDELHIPHWKGETSFISMFWPDVSSCLDAAKKAGIALTKGDNNNMFVFAIRKSEDNDKIIEFMEEQYPFDEAKKQLNDMGL